MDKIASTVSSVKPPLSEMTKRQLNKECESIINEYEFAVDELKRSILDVVKKINAMKPHAKQVLEEVDKRIVDPKKCPIHMAANLKLVSKIIHADAKAVKSLVGEIYGLAVC